MAVERTISIIQPDAVAKNVIGEIYTRFERSGLRIVAAKMTWLARPDAEGFYAMCIQHEIDHLNGVLFIDYLSKLKRDRVQKKFSKAAKRGEE